MIPQEVDEALECGNHLAAMVGELVAALEAGDSFTVEALDAAREGILTWHRVRAFVLELP